LSDLDLHDFVSTCFRTLEAYSLRTTSGLGDMSMRICSEAMKTVG